MQKTLLAAAALFAFTSCTHKTTTFLVEEPESGMILYTRYRDVKKDEGPTDRQVAEMTGKLTRGRTPEELGREYFPDLKPDEKAYVSIAPYTGGAPAKPGWSGVCYVPQVTVTAKASRKNFQQALDRINEDFYQRAKATGGVVTWEELPMVDNRKAADR